MTKHPALPLLTAILSAALLVLAVFPAAAQGIYQWAPARQIPSYSLIGRPPLMVADRTGKVHAFNFESASTSPAAIYYRSWSVEQGWSPPVDIFLTGITSVPGTLQSVFIDNQDIIHLTYYSGTDQTGDMMYAFAYAAAPDRAQNWSRPVEVGPQAGPLPAAMLTGDGDENLVLLYGGQQNGIGLYQIHSRDGGETWSTPSYLSLINQKEHWPTSIRTAYEDGQLHVVWSIVNQTGLGEEVRYGRLDLEDMTWNDETVLARQDPGDYSTNWPSIISSGDNLIVIYQDSFPAARFMVRSNDAGKTWSLPVRPFPEVGEYENAVLLKDSSGGFHMLLGNRTSDTIQIHGMWYSRWLGSRWTPLEPVISGPDSETFDPSAPSGVISQGNRLLVTWRNDIRREFMTGIWYSSALVDAPALPQATLIPPPATSTPPVMLFPTAANTATPTPLPTPTIPAELLAADPGNPFDNPAAPIFLGVIPVVVILVVLARRRLFQMR